MKNQKSKTFQIGNLKIEKNTFTIMAGPCSIENFNQFRDIVNFLIHNKISIIRGGIFKLRTNPSHFQGLREEAFPIVKKVKNEIPFQFITEITDPRQIPSLIEVTEVFQVGTRNMYNYDLLKELSSLSQPVLLKRSFSATLKEWLLAAEYLAKGGKKNIILCERGIRTFETAYRNTCDINAIVYLKKNSPFPVFLDPSHATGDHSFVIPISLAAYVAGADGLILEVHKEPQKALSDGKQALTFSEFELLLKQLQELSKISNKKLQ